MNRYDKTTLITVYGRRETNFEFALELYSTFRVGADQMSELSTESYGIHRASSFLSLGLLFCDLETFLWFFFLGTLYLCSMTYPMTFFPTRNIMVHFGLESP